ncbi:MAG TPA: N-ethylammeline chlorohydrolase [Chloroflexi bacterium]|nr:N-ethylammeline chlorohydrolase [Chloroflexota bacterium]HCU98792.1 N-ethylammeline chlorohydrolase [Chloroflexota bacterium]|tara:strand:- start:229 stop:1554 length:1326 start_codon:yes stop_codon:yes gene_type:complete
MSNKTLLTNLDIVTLDKNETIQQNASIMIEDGLITKIFDSNNLENKKNSIDCTGKIAMPGLVNAHCHSPMNMVRGWAEDLPFVEWLEAIWVAESGITPDDVYWAASLAAAEMIKSGTIAYNDKYFYMNKIADVVKESGMKAALTWTVFGMGENTEVGEGLHETIDWIKSLEDHPNIKTYIGPHSPYLCPENFIRQCINIALELKKGLHLHVAETQEQVHQSIERYNLRPVQHLDSLGAFDLPDSTVAAHTLHVDQRDLQILAQKNVLIPHCPITYMKLAMPFPSLQKSLDADIQICLGTDGPGSNSDMDMFAVIRQTALVHKHLSNDPTILSGDTLLRMATKTGSKTIGMQNHGTIKVGAPADLILINMDAPHLKPTHNLVANIINCVKGSDVSDTMVNGKWLMRNRVLQTLDEEKILYEANKRSLNVVNRGKKQLRHYTH